MNTDMDMDTDIAVARATDTDIDINIYVIIRIRMCRICMYIYIDRYIQIFRVCIYIDIRKVEEMAYLAYLQMNSSLHEDFNRSTCTIPLSHCPALQCLTLSGTG